MHKFKFAFFIVSLILLSGSGAFAAEGGEHPLPWDNFGWRVLNIILFGCVIAYFFGKKIKAALTNRTASIANEISTLEQRKADAKARLADVEQSIASLDKERASILATYHEQGEALKAEIITQAEKTAIQITEQAIITAQNEVSQSIESIRSMLADEIVSATEKAIVAKVTPAEQAKLVDKYLTRVVLN